MTEFEKRIIFVTFLPNFLVLDAAPEDGSGQMPLAASLLAPVTFQPEHGVLDNELGDIRRRFERTLRPKELAVFRLKHTTV